MSVQEPLPDDCNQAEAVDHSVLEASQRALTRSAAALAAYCEHVEHNEPNSVADAVRAGDQLRGIALTLSAEGRVSLRSAYAERLRAIEEMSPLRHVVRIEDPPNLPGADALASAETWADIQVAQLIHDRQFHPDVFGLSKLDQIRHYTFHVTKLAGLLIDAIDNDDWTSFRQERLADIAIFGVKIATVCNMDLPHNSVS